MNNHKYRAVFAVALAALALGVAALAGAPQTLAAVPTFTIVNADGDVIPDVEAGDYDVSTIVGTGSDTIEVAIPGATTTWNLTAFDEGTITIEGYNTITFRGIGALTGGGGDDRFVFSPFLVPSGSVAVRIDGGAGTNALDYSPRTNGVTVNLSTTWATATSVITNIQDVIGGSDNDSLTGDAGNNVLTGGLGLDTLTGGAGLDTVVETRDANFTLDNVHLTIGAEGNDTLAGIEAAHLTGGPGNNTLNALTFTAGQVVLDGGAGNDTLTGGAGSDRLIGGAGDDVMLGRGGNDQYSGGPGTNTITEAAGGGTDTIAEICDSDFALTNTGLVWVEGKDWAGAGNPFLGNIENVTLVGGYGDNDFNVSALAGGTIFVDGGVGTDKLTVDPHGAPVTLITNGIAVPAFSQSTTYVSIEAVTVVAPILHLPDNMTVEATSAAGAIVEFTATAEDTIGGPLAVTCDPASGSTFPLGATTVNCRATDASGNTTTGSFTVTVVVDTTAPVLHLPDNMTVQATSAAGAAVEFTATADDVVDGSVAVSCDPVSGSTFPLGTTTVDCDATDLSGNTATGSFTITVVVGWSGFLQPVNADGSSIFKLGSTVPVKFALTGGSAGIADLTARFTYAKVSNGIAGESFEAVSTSAVTSGNLFRYDPASGQYIFNWGTKGLTRGTYQLRVALGDGSEHVVLASLK